MNVCTQFSEHVRMPVLESKGQRPTANNTNDQIENRCATVYVKTKNIYLYIVDLARGRPGGDGAAAHRA
jgi:hypothetical protein